MSLNRVLSVFAILVAALLITPMARAQQGEAASRINTFHASIIEVMRHWLCADKTYGRDFSASQAVHAK